MLITKKELLVAVALTTISLLLSTTLTITSNEPPVKVAKPDIVLITVPPREIVNESAKVSLEDAIKAVKNIWPLVPANATVKAYIIKDDHEEIVFWDISWRNSGETLLTAQVDAEKGTVCGVLDLRLIRESRVDNIKSASKAVEIARGFLIDILRKLGIDLSQLSNPDVKLDVAQIEDGPQITYLVVWQQIYRGLRVVRGFVAVTINAEKGIPAGFRINLIDVSRVDTSPVIQRDEAVQIARTLAEQRGYRVGGVESVELCIIRPNYYWSGLLGRLGNPTLVWLVVLRDPCGYPIEVHVDAKTGEVVGGQVSRCKCEC